MENKTERTINNVSEYVTNVSDFVKWAESKSQYLGRKIIFRGQSDANWDLVPSSQRQPDLLNPHIDRNTAEITAKNVCEKEQYMLAEFKKLSRPHINDTPKTEWEWLALAQHYGLATRLLDWTEYAGAALFFAVQKMEYELEASITESAVWCCIAPIEAPEESKNPFEVNNVYLYKPPHIAPRITVQRGAFTVHPTNYKIEPLNWLGTRDSSNEKYTKILIPRSMRQNIREDLKRIGIHRASLFPELSVISSEINKIHSNKDLNFIITW